LAFHAETVIGRISMACFDQARNHPKL
jgi:hypothetical protein